jgi:flagellar protein FlaG
MIDPQELQRKLEEAVKRLNEQMQDNRRQLGFSVDDRLNRQVVRVTNQETGELVRQIPSEVVIRVANSIENLKGVLFDKEF